MQGLLPYTLEPTSVNTFLGLEPGSSHLGLSFSVLVDRIPYFTEVETLNLGAPSHTGH